MEQNQRLTDEDLDKLSGLMILGFHIAELACSKMEYEYATRYKGEQYADAVKAYGKAYADKLVLDAVKKEVRNDERHKIGDLLNAFESVKIKMEKLTSSALEAREDDASYIEVYDALHNNVNYWSYIYLLMSNFTNGDDFLKIESQIKLLAKGNSVSDRVIKLFDNKFKR